MRWPAVACLAVTACAHAGDPAAHAPEPADRDAALYGSPAWRALGAIRYVAVADDGSAVAVSEFAGGGAVATFAPSGERGPLIAVGSLYEAAADGPTALVVAQDGHATRVDLAARTTTTMPAQIEAVAAAPTLMVARADHDAPLVATPRTPPGAPVELVHSRGYRAPHIVGGKVIASRPYRAVGIWDAATGVRERAFAAGDQALFALAPDGAHLATGVFSGNRAHYAIALWDVATGDRTGLVADLTCSPSALAISPDGATLAIACDRELRLVHVPDGAPIAALPTTGFALGALAWSPNGALLATGGGDGIVRVYRAAPDWQHPAAPPAVVGSRGEVRDVVVAGRYLAIRGCCDDTAWLWVTDRAKPVVDYGGTRDHWIRAVALAEDGRALVGRWEPDSGGHDTTVERWEAGARAPGPARSLARPDAAAPLLTAIGLGARGAWVLAGATLYALDDDLAIAWRFTLGPETSDAHATADAHGRRVLVRSGDQFAVVEPAARRVVAQAKILDCGIVEAALSPDGKRVAILDDHGLHELAVEGNLGPGRSVSVPHRATGGSALAWHGDGEVAALIEGRLVVWSPAAGTLRASAAPDVSAIAFAGGDVYLGRGDGLVERHGVAALAFTATPARPAEACTEESTGSMFGVLGGLGSSGVQGRLDDRGAYDEPDPTPEGE